VSIALAARWQGPPAGCRDCLSTALAGRGWMAVAAERQLAIGIFDLLAALLPLYSRPCVGSWLILHSEAKPPRIPAAFVNWAGGQLRV
jgi:hypothetical protein